MALVGKLEDLNLTELFHVLSLFQKSGRLTLSADKKKGVFLFKGGKIIHAANGSPRESLGQELLTNNLISESTLRKALDIQAADTEHRRLGRILVSMGKVTEEQIDDRPGDFGRVDDRLVGLDAPRLGAPAWDLSRDSGHPS